MDVSLASLSSCRIHPVSHLHGFFSLLYLRDPLPIVTLLKSIPNSKPDIVSSVGLSSRFGLESSLADLLSIMFLGPLAGFGNPLPSYHFLSRLELSLHVLACSMPSSSLITSRD